MNASAAPASDALAAAALQRDLAAHGLRLDWVEQTGSTNADLLQRVRTQACAPQPQCLVAGRQSAGRGRQGRAWSDDGAALLMSLAWPLPPHAAVGALSLATGVWTARALQQLGTAAPRLKWPNDLLLGESKLAGILIELADTPAARWAVIGIGVNLRRPTAPSGAAGLDDCGVHASRWDLMRVLAPTLLDGLHAYARDGFAPLADAWNALHAWAGREVEVLDHGAVRAAGVALGADADGCLLLRDAQGVRRIASGDVSLRCRATATTNGAA